MSTAQSFTLNQFVQLDEYYLDLDDPDYEDNGYPWKRHRPHIVIDDVSHNPANQKAPLSWGDSIAFCTPTSAGTVLQFETLIHAGVVSCEDGSTVILFGYRDALMAAGATTTFPAEEILRDQLERNPITAF